MDHLSIPDKPAFPPIEVPFYGMLYHDDKCLHSPDGTLCDDCDNRKYHGWFYFPDRFGLRSSDTWSTGFGSPAIQNIAVLQAWLWFGLLHVFFQNMISIKAEDMLDFVRDKADPRGDASPGRILDTSSLSEVLPLWKGWYSKLAVPEQDQHFQRMRTIFARISTLCGIWGGSSESVSPKPGNVVPQELQLSVIVLASTLQQALYATHGKGHEANFLNPALVRERLRQNSWCPVSSIILNPSTGVSVAYYATMLGARKHKSGFTHDNCTPTCCREADVDVQKYNIEHISMSCQCEHHFAQTELFVRILLEREAVPLFVFPGEAETKQYCPDRKAGLHCVAPIDDYVAISHVWADGRGNPSGNSLPLCQLRAIQDQVNALYPEHGPQDSSVPFFMDTLCIPIFDESNDTDCRGRDSRRVAISRLRDIYSDASKVLILDLDLQKTCSKNTDIVELFVRLATSRWAQRLWTLQEIALSKTAFIQLSDGAVSWTDVSAELAARAMEVALWDVVTAGVSLWSKRQALAKDLVGPNRWPDHTHRIYLAFDCASKRATSHKEDELVVLGLMAGFDRAQIKGVLAYTDSGSRYDDLSLQTCHFLDILGIIPKMLLLEPNFDNPHCQQKGRRACPIDLLATWRFWSGPRSPEVHTVNDRGVQGAWDGFWLRPPSSAYCADKIASWHSMPVSKTRQPLIPFATTTYYFVMKEATTEAMVQVLLTTELEREELAQVVLGKNMVLLVADYGESADRKRHTMLVTTDNYHPSSEGSTGDKSSQTVIYAHWVAAGTIGSPEDTQRWADTRTFEPEIHSPGMPIGERVRNGQIWCID